MTGLSQRLLARNWAALRPFEEHRFFTEAAQGTLPPNVRDAYFRYERRFVDQAVVVVSHCLSKAPGLASRRHLHAILQGLLYDQQDCFAEIFDALGLSPVENPPAAVLQFCDGMTAIAADGSYAEGIAALLVAEHTYALVSRRMVGTPPPDWQLRLWFDLHAAPEFQDSAVWMAEELDRFGPVIEPSGALDRVMQRAAHLEAAFHDAAWHNSTES